MLDLTSIELIIFDCDGVLVDSEALAAEVFAKHLSAVGWTITAQECGRRFTGLSLSSCGQLIEAKLGKALPHDFFTAMQKETFTRFDRDLLAVEGVEDLLKGLTLPYCIASSGDYDKLSRTLTKTRLKQYFGDNIYSAVEVAKGKPEPDLLLYAAHKMGAIAAANCLVIEDSLPGIAAAKAAGMQSVQYVPNGQPLSPLATEHVTSMAQLQRRLIIATRIVSDE